MHFRASVEKLYSKCLITGYDASECDAAHIVPQHICRKLGQHAWIEDPFNGLLLSKNLHSSFDRYIWTFDIYDWEPDETPDHIQIKSLICESHDQIMIKSYLNPTQPYRIPKMSLKYLQIHYHAYFTRNYINLWTIDDRHRLPVRVTHRRRPKVNSLTPENYQEIIDEKPYQLRYLDHNMKIPRTALYVLAHRRKPPCLEYLYLWEGYPYRDRLWTIS